jgi:para-aminobenzoate synthetase/4-amino-4-deoxychorismate lyase
LLLVPGTPFGEEPGRQWMQFEEPEQSIIAWELDEVLDALARVEAAAATGKWVVGLVSYDAAPAFDRALAAQRNPNVPLVAFGVFSHGTPSPGPTGGRFETTPWIAEREQADYEADIRSIRDRIAAGDTYQVNHTMRLRARFEGDPLGLFEALCRAQQGDHVCFLDLGDAAICSASPELFFTRSGTTLTTRPMKGTRPRHPDPIEDQALIDGLRASDKDRAENTMIVDMTRNDLGRIATVGSLAVPTLHAIETYPTVHQMTSTVTAESEASLTEIFGALFPGASITGAPKVSTSRIVTAIEGSPRGVYTGSLGIVGPNGFAEFNIAIRTVWIDHNSGDAEYGTGGGIVWDSDPTDEWHEAHHKARVLDRACASMRLLETIKYEPKHGLVLLDRHVDRVTAAAEHFRYDLDTIELRRVLDAVQLEGAARIRLLVDSNGGVDLDITPEPESAASTWHLPIDTEPVDTADEWLYFKTTERARYDEARARFPHAPDVILWNERGEVTETTIGNLVIELDGAWYTPHASSGLLPGTFRAELLDQGVVTERVITLGELAGARRVWMINSVRGWVPAAVESAELLAASINR